MGVTAGPHRSRTTALVAADTSAAAATPPPTPRASAQTDGAAPRIVRCQGFMAASSRVPREGTAAFSQTQLRPAQITFNSRAHSVAVSATAETSQADMTPSGGVHSSYTDDRVSQLKMSSNPYHNNTYMKFFNEVSATGMEDTPATLPAAKYGERDRERDAKQAERDRERDAKQAERDRERDAEQAERDQRLVAEFACMQAERDKERDARQAERDKERDAKQAERDKERDVGDEAFRLRKHILKTYTRSSAHQDKSKATFNYKLS
ncbi:serine/threonine-protein kinase fray2-like [Schistocerca serialis cubense]|uniref:serine/threonine-protein kinase fray2-like n=1 Tax=Schistocerca serialis cubense TaxID=2023355 RepID=UPI00214E493C|nr:serine/threonine-protein kinase fray2-like [Schistocerca serialis cubense]